MSVYIPELDEEPANLAEQKAAGGFIVTCQLGQHLVDVLEVCRDTLTELREENRLLDVDQVWLDTLLETLENDAAGLGWYVAAAELEAPDRLKRRQEREARRAELDALLRRIEERGEGR